ncbi:Crp/Fnr family transcriptional regulator [Aquiflexum lacus]|uniref:Crp/Fnr family transcriptional regulator n=1 Tax=Aquiflexum lacus TaxID=2483805 RepID=UPI0018947AF5|nr:Crp/Fnr family transcriptional regulator [Aquiflexum lacus]
MEELKHILENDPSVKTTNFKKGDILLQPGGSSAHRFFVKKGILRSFILDSKGKEHIFSFASEGWIIGDVESLEFDRPGELFIDCIEDAEVIIFDKEIFSFVNLSKEDFINYTHLLYRRMGILQRRVMMLLSAPAVDRYAYFLKTYPELPNRIPQRMIAAFLGITPQALSTIRSKIASSE